MRKNTVSWCVKNNTTRYTNKFHIIYRVISRQAKEPFCMYWLASLPLTVIQIPFIPLRQETCLVLTETVIFLVVFLRSPFCRSSSYIVVTFWKLEKVYDGNLKLTWRLMATFHQDDSSPNSLPPHVAGCKKSASEITVVSSNVKNNAYLVANSFRAGLNKITTKAWFSPATQVQA